MHIISGGYFKEDFNYDRYLYFHLLTWIYYDNIFVKFILFPIRTYVHYNLKQSQKDMEGWVDNFPGTNISLLRHIELWKNVPENIADKTGKLSEKNRKNFLKALYLKAEERHIWNMRSTVFVISWILVFSTIFFIKPWNLVYCIPFRRQLTMDLVNPIFVFFFIRSTGKTTLLGAIEYYIENISLSSGIHIDSERMVIGMLEWLLQNNIADLKLLELFGLEVLLCNNKDNDDDEDSVSEDSETDMENDKYYDRNIKIKEMPVDINIFSLLKYWKNIFFLNPEPSSMGHVWEFFPYIILNDFLDIFLNCFLLIRPAYKTLSDYKQNIIDLLLKITKFTLEAPINSIGKLIVVIFTSFTNICKFIFERSTILGIHKAIIATWSSYFNMLLPYLIILKDYFLSLWKHLFHVSNNTIEKSIANFISPLQFILSLTSDQITKEEALNIHSYLGWLYTASSSMSVVFATNLMKGKFNSYDFYFYLRNAVFLWSLSKILIISQTKFKEWLENTVHFVIYKNNENLRLYTSFTAVEELEESKYTKQLMHIEIEDLEQSIHSDTIHQWREIIEKEQELKKRNRQARYPHRLEYNDDVLAIESSATMIETSRPEDLLPSPTVNVNANSYHLQEEPVLPVVSNVQTSLLLEEDNNEEPLEEAVIPTRRHSSHDKYADLFEDRPEDHLLQESELYIPFNKQQDEDSLDDAPLLPIEERGNNKFNDLITLFKIWSQSSRVGIERLEAF